MMFLVDLEFHEMHMTYFLYILHSVMSQECFMSLTHKILGDEEPEPPSYLYFVQIYTQELFWT